MVPPGLPDAFLASDLRPLVSIARRFARTHGPFTALDLAQTVTLLNYGRVIVDGARDAVVADPRTREVYLGV